MVYKGYAMEAKLSALETKFQKLEFSVTALQNDAVQETEARLSKHWKNPKFYTEIKW